MIYPPALNGVFSDAFFDLGWLQSSEAIASAAPAMAEANQPEAAPSIEPTPLPNIALAKNERERPAEPLSLAVQQPNPPVPGMEAMTSTAGQPPAASSAVGATASPSVETPVASTASPAAARAVIATSSDPDQADEAAAAKPRASAIASLSGSPATILAPAKVREWSQPTWNDRLSEMPGNTLLVTGALLAGILLLGWAVIPELRRRFSKPASQQNFAPANGPSFDEAEPAEAVEQFVPATRLAGGPPQVSLQLRASEPALRRATMPVGKSGRPFGTGNGVSHSDGSGNGHATPAPAPVQTIAPPAETLVQRETFVPASVAVSDEGVREPQPVEARQGIDVGSPVFPVLESPKAVEWYEPETAPVAVSSAVSSPEPESAPIEIEEAEVAPAENAAPVFAQAPAVVESTYLQESTAPAFEAADSSVTEASPTEPVVEEAEPIGQGQPIPCLTPVTSETPSAPEVSTPDPKHPSEPRAPIAAVGAALAGIGALRHSVESTPFVPQVVTDEPTAQQPITPTMPIPAQPTPSPVIRTGPSSPTTAPAAQPHAAAPQQQAAAQTGGGGGGSMHTAVQLTFSTEIASLQLTPTFEMGSLQLKPTSRIVTMRLAPSQNPQPAMNLQVTFEIASVQLAGNAIGSLRLTPSQQQRPGVISSPSFNIAGLQLVSGSDAAPVQLTPSQQGQASVHLTGGFQIATLEFSPTFEIASIVLNSTSKSVQVQLPGSGPSSPEGAPIFEITNVQLAGSGEIGMIHLNPHGAGPKPA